MNEADQQRINRAIGRTMMRRAYWIGGSVLAVAGIIWLGIIISKKTAIVPPGQTYENLGQGHISLQDKLPREYNSNPPSSGAHYASPANWGIYDYEVNDRIFIHNLEHGGIWIAYDPSVSSEVVAELKAIADEFGGLKIVMAPRSANDADVAVAAWMHVYKFNLARHDGGLTDQQKTDMRNFYKALRDHAPEDVPSFMAGVDPKEVK